MKPSLAGKFYARANDYAKVDYKIPIPISKHLLLFSYADVREFNQSVYKRTYISEKYDLLHNGYIDWLTNRIKEIGNMEFLKYICSISKSVFFLLQINSVGIMITVSMLSSKSSTRAATIPPILGPIQT